MIEPTGSSPIQPLQQSQSLRLDVPQLTVQMQAQTLALIEQLKKILEDPSLSKEEVFLREVTENGNQLHQTVEQAIQLR